MTFNKVMLVIITSMMLTACGDGGSDENAFKAQTEALDKAKEVEGKILDAASQQQQAIEESTE